MNVTQAIHFHTTPQTPTVQIPTVLTPNTAPAAAQVAALCWRMHKGHVQVLLITSRDTGRWVIPKGWPMTGLSPAAAAAREAWEEAGVIGQIRETALGEFLYDKVFPAAAQVTCVVAVYPLRVHALKARFPEAKQRRRTWVRARDAADMVAEPTLQELLRHIDGLPDLLGDAA